MVAWVVGFLGLFSQRIASLGILQSEEDVQLTGRTHKFLHYTTPTLHHNTHNTTTFKGKLRRMFSSTHPLISPQCPHPHLAGPCPHLVQFWLKTRGCSTNIEILQKRVNACFYWWSLFTSLHGKRQVKNQVKRGNKPKFLRGLPA